MPDSPLCLGIESSCDETALAVARGGRLLGAVLASQAELHALFGGVVPELASREHLRLMGTLLDKLLADTGISLEKIDVVAVTRGPGLLGSLLVGMAFAKGLALAFAKPLIGINHLHAHILASGLEQEMVFPALALIISGGHTEIYRIESPAHFRRLGRTLDDACGEVLDKVGQFLGLAYPAGDMIDHLASSADEPLGQLPRPYTDNDNLDFSFSGLKTAAINLAQRLNLPENSRALPGFCRTLNEAIAETLGIKLLRAWKANPDLQRLYIAGGVAANTIIRDHLRTCLPIVPVLPNMALCGDNAAMVAHAGSILFQAGYHHALDLEAIPRGRLIPDDMLGKDFPA